MPNMDGNPHYGPAQTQVGADEGAIEATLALAYEQRTANLLTILIAAHTTVNIGGLDMDKLARETTARLGL